MTKFICSYAGDCHDYSVVEQKHPNLTDDDGEGIGNFAKDDSEHPADEHPPTWNRCCPSAGYQEGNTVTIFDAKLFLSIMSVCQNTIHDIQRSKTKKSCPRLLNRPMRQILLYVICCYG
ncbi:MAG: hypothetical protein RBR41_12575 [Desulfovibrio sp.]|uniref:hypothetical protein n=1 Tax=Desulfovibrio sp. TaxID=885 RepID=UPI002A35CB97|nr:hypothetical protein [Desulfovibrio sp.]MDY0260485.1 hypothetical protein [Desulfovibrio sp.]